MKFLAYHPCLILNCPGLYLSTHSFRTYGSTRLESLHAHLSDPTYKKTHTHTEEVAHRSGYIVPALHLLCGQTSSNANVQLYGTPSLRKHIMTVKARFTCENRPGLLSPFSTYAFNCRCAQLRTEEGDVLVSRLEGLVSRLK